MAILCGIALAAFGGRRPVIVTVGLAAMAAGTALTGHAATGEPQWLVPATQAVHSLAGLVWVGAFVPLLWGCARWQDDEMAKVARGFSGIGIVCVIALAAAGLCLAATRIPLPEALYSSEYGNLVAVKFALFAVMLALATYNRYRVLRSGRRRFAFNVAAEFALAVLALGATANLSYTPPHATSAYSDHAPARRLGPSIAIVRDGRVLFVEIVGERLDMHFGDGAGKGFDPLEVDVLISSESGGIDGLRRRAGRVGTGHYRIEEPSLRIPGLWRIEIGSLVSDFRKDTFATELRVGAKTR